MLVLLAAMPAAASDFSRVAVVVFAQGAEVPLAARAAQIRLEGILIDNGIEVLDQEKTQELTDVWAQLEDPGYFVTAEDFIEKAETYAIDGVVRVYLATDVVAGIANFFSATAQADIRFVAEDAKVTAFTTPSMGIRGNPPSDGLTARAAIINAVQRATDNAAGEVGLELLETAAPRSIQLELAPVADPSASTPVAQSTISVNVVPYAEMVEETWRKSEVTCEAVSPDGKMGVVGAYIREGMRDRLYGSTLHVIDIEAKREILQLDTAEIERRERWEKGPAKIHDCKFIGSWRFVAAVTGNHLFLFDTERGLELSRIHIEGGLNKASIDILTAQDGRYLVAIREGRQTRHFEIRRKS